MPESNSDRGKQFIIGCVIGAVVLFMFQIFSKIPVLEWDWLPWAFVIFSGIWFSRRGNRKVKGLWDFNAWRSQYYANERDSVAQEEPPEDVSQQVADQALRRAGYDPQTTAVRLHDIGLLVYKGGSRPVGIARDESIRTDVSHVRPFIRFDYPMARPGDDSFRFELINEQGKALYQDEDWYDLVPGDNLLTTRTWMPVKGKDADGRWTLRVLVGKTPLAIHPFRWRKVRDDGPQVPLKSDGEIDLAEASASRPPSDGPLSLDELLSDQEPVQKSTVRRH